MKLWSVTSGQCLFTFGGVTGGVLALAVLDAGRVVSGGEDKMLNVWDVVSGECVQALPGHSSEVCAVAGLDADRVVSYSWDNTLKVWSATDRRRHMAALQIHRHWRDAISNPERKLCRKWLQWQCNA